MGRFANQDGLEGSKTTAFSKARHPELPSMRARSRVPICAPFLRVNGQSARIGARDLLFSKHKVSHDYSPADENADSFTPFEMTVSKGTE